jgi:hypothetical protein
MNYLNKIQNCNHCGKIMIAKSTFPIYWAHISVLEADLVCLKLLYAENEGKKIKPLTTNQCKIKPFQNLLFHGKL